MTRVVGDMLSMCMQLAARERLSRPAARGAPMRPPAAPRGPPMRLPPPPAPPKRGASAASANDLLGLGDGWDDAGGGGGGGSPVSTASAASAFSSGVQAMQCHPNGEQAARW